MPIIITPPSGGAGGGGTVNDGSNPGASGVGVFISKVVDVLTFKKFRSPDSEISITDNVADSTIDIDVNEANLDYWGLPYALYSGDGSDGSVTISGNTTLTSDMYYNNLTVNNGIILTTDGYKVHVKGTLTNNGTIRAVAASSAATNGSGATRGDGTILFTSGTTFLDADGGNGGTGVVGVGAIGSSGGTQSTFYSLGGFGGNSGAGGNGTSGSGGVSRSATTNNGLMKVPRLITTWCGLNKPNSTNEGRYMNGGTSGYGGSSGAGDGANAGGGGGGGGAGGGVVAIYCNILDNTGGTISANGFAAGNGAARAVGNVGGGGGGAGGGGGLVYIVANSITAIGTISVAGGAAGTGGAGFGTGTAGSNGTAGAIGHYVYIEGKSSTLTTNY